jgi:hypothetical protein
MANEVGDFLEEIGDLSSTLNREADRIGNVIRQVEKRLEEMGAGVEVSGTKAISEEERKMGNCGDHIKCVGLKYMKVAGDWLIWIIEVTDKGHVNQKNSFRHCNRGLRLVAYLALPNLLKGIIYALKDQKDAEIPDIADGLLAMEEGSGIATDDFFVGQIVTLVQDWDHGKLKAGQSVLVSRISGENIISDLEDDGPYYSFGPDNVVPAKFQVGDMVRVDKRMPLTQRQASIMARAADNTPKKIVGYGTPEFPYKVEGMTAFGESRLIPLAEEQPDELDKDETVSVLPEAVGAADGPMAMEVTLADEEEKVCTCSEGNEIKKGYMVEVVKDSTCHEIEIGMRTRVQKIDEDFAVGITVDGRDYWIQQEEVKVVEIVEGPDRVDPNEPRRTKLLGHKGEEFIMEKKAVTIENWDRNAGLNPTVTLYEDGKVSIEFDELPGCLKNLSHMASFEDLLETFIGEHLPGVEVEQEDRELFWVQGLEGPEQTFSAVVHTLELQAKRPDGNDLM